MSLTRARAFGRQLGRRFPRAMPAVLTMGRWLLVSALIVLGVSGAILLMYVVVALVHDYGAVARDVSLGVFFLTVQWVAAWPGYVWLALLGVMLLSRIGTQLACLNHSVRRLTKAVRAGRAKTKD